MLQIIGLLLCIYLFFKGVEIFQLHITDPNKPRGASGFIGYGSLIACTGLAVLFGLWLLVAGEQVNQAIPR